MDLSIIKVCISAFNIITYNVNLECVAFKILCSSNCVIIYLTNLLSIVNS